MAVVIKITLKAPFTSYNILITLSFVEPEIGSLVISNSDNTDLLQATRNPWPMTDQSIGTQAEFLVFSFFLSSSLVFPKKFCLLIRWERISEDMQLISFF